MLDKIKTASDKIKNIALLYFFIFNYYFIPLYPISVYSRLNIFNKGHVSVFSHSSIIRLGSVHCSSSENGYQKQLALRRYADTKYRS